MLENQAHSLRLGRYVSEVTFLLILCHICLYLEALTVIIQIFLVNYYFFTKDLWVLLCVNSGHYIITITSVIYL